jgi:hypothetical protein
MIITNYYPHHGGYIVGTAYNDPMMGKSLVARTGTMVDARHVQGVQIYTIIKHYLDQFLSLPHDIDTNLKSPLDQCHNYADIKQHVIVFGSKYLDLAKCLKNDALWVNRIENFIAYYDAH